MEVASTAQPPPPPVSKPATPAPVSTASSPEKPSHGPLQQLKDLVAGADAAAAQHLATELKALVKQCEQRVIDQRKAQSESNLGAMRWSGDATCLQPRGKMTLRVGETAIVVCNPKDGAVKGEFPFATMTAVLTLPPTEKSAPTEAATVLLAAAVSAPRPPGKITAKLMQDAFKKASLSLTVNDKYSKSTPCNDGMLASKAAALLSTLARVPDRSFLRKGQDPACFKSTVSNLPYVKASLGASQGNLHLADLGIIFLKPLVFLPCECIASIECGRAGAGNCSSFDLVVEMERPWDISDDDKPAKPPAFEFSNIRKDELEGVQKFVRDVLLPARAVKRKEAAAKAGAPAAEVDGDSEEDDADYEALGSEDSSSSSEDDSSLEDSEAGDDRGDETDSHDEREPASPSEPAAKKLRAGSQ